MLYTYSFANRKRDLSDILSTVVRDEPRFISNFKPVPEARMRKHEWLEDQMAGRSLKAVSISDGVLSVSLNDAAKVKEGTLLALEGTAAVKLQKGDALDLDGSGKMTIGDVTVLLDHLAGEQVQFAPYATPDVNGDGAVTIGDVTALLDHLSGVAA